MNKRHGMPHNSLIPSSSHQRDKAFHLPTIAPTVAPPKIQAIDWPTSACLRFITDYE